VIIVYLINIYVNKISLEFLYFLIYNNHMKSKAGRPPKEPGTALSESILLRLEPAEKAAFRDAAAAAGLPLSAWVRERLRKLARRELENIGQPVAFLMKLPAL
jgi:predicted HicB family RNase H-like nuclease